mgnify:CR=1 FL=1|jgi:hypothetical protein
MCSVYTDYLILVSKHAEIRGACCADAITWSGREFAATVGLAENSLSISNTKEYFYDRSVNGPRERWAAEMGV